MAIAIVVIAAAILVYFAYFSGKQAPGPEIRDEVSDETVINAEVSGKRVEKIMGKHGPLTYYYISFECGDGESREFSVNPAIYEAVAVGERDELVYAGGRFMGFGSHGAVEGGMDADESGEEDGFTYDDYDESIDIEQVAEAPSPDRMDPADRGLFERFRNREQLPAKTETVEDETEGFREYSALTLLEKTTIYPFLKGNDEVRRMFVSTYFGAMDDLLGFEGDSRRGRSADSARIRKNEIRVAITIQENPKPLKDRITAEFGVND